jgi:flavin reductase (DIM6/NTAB) family NADH-FMN oxidoreductase RutF
MADQGGIHSEHPFAAPPELRSPARLLRGRLASPVSIWTSGPPEERAGLTVSSLMVADGQPSLVVGLVGDPGELWDAIRSTGAFVVHVLERRHRELADRFARVRPSPGGVFRGLEVEESDWGPILADVPARARCRLEGSSETGYYRLVRGVIERVDMHDVEEPLVYFRGRYWPPRR